MVLFCAVMGRFEAQKRSAQIKGRPSAINKVKVYLKILGV